MIRDKIDASWRPRHSNAESSKATSKGYKYKRSSRCHREYTLHTSFRKKWQQERSYGFLKKSGVTRKRERREYKQIDIYISRQNLRRFLVTWFDLVCAVIALHYKRARVSACKRSRSLATSKLNRNEFHHRRRTGSTFKLDIPFYLSIHSTKLYVLHKVPEHSGRILRSRCNSHSLFIRKSEPRSLSYHIAKTGKKFRGKISRLSRW